MTMDPDIGLPALNAMLLIGAEAARYGAPGESVVLALAGWGMMRDHHRRPVMGVAPRQRVMSELAIQPGDAVLMHLEDGFRGDTPGMTIMNHLEVGHHALATAHLFSAGEVRPEGGAQKPDTIQNHRFIFQQKCLPVIGEDAMVIFVVAQHEDDRTSVGQAQLAQKLRVVFRHGVHVPGQDQPVGTG